MRAAHLVSAGLVEVREAPQPRAEDLGDGEILLRVTAAGICGSDLPAYRGSGNAFLGETRWPGFPGHEVAGRVLASRADDIPVGSHVVGWATRIDALAEFVVTRADEVTRYDPTLWRPEQAILVQPLACVIYAVDQLGPVDALDVAVIGQGAIGVLFDHVLADRGARVTGIDRVDRAAVAALGGVTEMVRASSREWARSIGSGAHPDIVIEAVGHQAGTLTDAIRAVRPLGTIFLFGVPDDEPYPLPMDEFLLKNLTLRSGIARDRRRSLDLAVGYLGAHPELLPIVTDVLPLDEASVAFALAASPEPGRLKIVLTS